MANEAAVTANIIFETGYAQAVFSAISLPIDVSGDDYVKTAMSLTTGLVPVAMGGVSNFGGIMVGKVKPNGGDVIFMVSTESEFIRFKSGDPFILRFAVGASVQVKATVDATEIEYLLLEA
jgi:hypothetical protein